MEKLLTKKDSLDEGDLMNITYTFLKTREKHHVPFCQDNVTLCNPFSCCVCGFFFFNLVDKENTLNCSFNSTVQQYNEMGILQKMN